MERAATEVMQSIVFSAVLDAVAALKSASGGLPNQLLRDVQAIHANVTFADLPKELQDAIASSTRSAFTQLLKEGYAVGPRQQMQAARPMDRVPERDRRAPNDRRTVRHGQGRHEIRSMPGIFQLSVEEAVREAESVARLGVPAVILFGLPAAKDEVGTENFAPDGIVQQALRRLRSRHPDLLLITDVCCCEYTSHGHCGIVREA